MQDDAFSPDDPGPPLRLSRGRAFVYVLPVRDDTVFKIGFARDPLQRWRSLHPRCLRYFDFRAGVLVETARVAQARALERSLLERFASWSALAPLAVKPAAGGGNEWFRGALEDASDDAEALASAEGFVVSRPIAGWLRPVFEERRDALFGWSARMLEAIEYARHNRPHDASARAYEHALSDVLEAGAELGIDVDALVPAAVARWRATRAV
ncbi:GIY-YIG nuclease family protein [Dokdonella sp.]|uniref:GIY-YIG nuclease family protein n=1 Tax=Dokdonella sp. TaxID=2291710 RepID=UPI002F3F6917